MPTNSAMTRASATTPAAARSATARPPWLVAWLSLALVALAGCSGEPSPGAKDAQVAADADGGAGDAAGGDSAGDGLSGDAGADSGAGSGDGRADPDAADPDATHAGPDPLAWGQGTLAPLDKPVPAAAEPTALASSSWRVAVFGSGEADLVGGGVEAGTLALPAKDASFAGKTWSEHVLDVHGELPAAGTPQQWSWALAEVTLAAPAAVVVQADRALEVRAKGARLPADLYGSGKLRLPLALAAGTHVIAIRGRGAQKVRIGLWTVPGPLWINVHDLTAPDLRVGVAEPLWLGAPLLAFGPAMAKDVRARVVASSHVAASEVAWPGLVPGGATQIGWKIVPLQAPTAATAGTDADGKPIPLKIPVTLQVVSDAHPQGWQATVLLEVREGEQAFRQTFRDRADGSVQYYGVRPPRDFDPKRSDYALVLSLHGAGVEGIGQAQAYAAKTWAWLAAPTNRRPFGFDWEEWGHWNGIHALDDATARFGTDPARTYLTGHSMGGHGTWQFGVHHAGRFAVVGPSAGWDSFYTYGNAPKPQGPLARARAHSDTSRFVRNLKDRAIYVIHGTADDNVPWSEGLGMHGKVSQHASDVHNHWEPGAGHWWDGDKSEGADCVDWPPLFALMQDRTLDRHELNFHFRSPGPYYTWQHSYLWVDAAESPVADTVAESDFDGATLRLKVSNIRRMRLDGAALRAQGPATLVLEGMPGGKQTIDLPNGPLWLGPAGGKRVGQSGPFNQAFQRPFALLVPDGDAEVATIAAYWATTWQGIGNGHAVVLPASAADHARAAGRNLVWFGAAPPTPLPVALSLPGGVAGPEGPKVGSKEFGGMAALAVMPRPFALGVDAVLWAPPEAKRLLYAVVPFSSRSGLPDWLVWDGSGLKAAGYWSEGWTAVDPATAIGL